jgi:hypothetical protein
MGTSWTQGTVCKRKGTSKTTGQTTVSSHTVYNVDTRLYGRGEHLSALSILNALSILSAFNILSSLKDKDILHRFL